MKQVNSIREISIIVFATIILTGIYLNLKIMLDQTFYQVFEGDLGLNFKTLIVFLTILTFLGILQYLIRQERPIHQKNDTESADDLAS